MVTTLYLVRHGETQGAEQKKYKGTIDVPLSEHGIEQIKELSAFLKKELKIKLSYVYCSDLDRAVKSAELIANPHGLKSIAVQDLRERNFGIWEGMSFEEIEKKYPAEFKAWAENPLKHSPPQGESTSEVKDRVLGALDNILKKHTGENIAIVAHGGVNRIILCHALGMPLENIFRIEQDFAALNIIEFWDKFPLVKTINFKIFI
ncbi:MAG: alpha-ribazole phosphatase [Nitrospiraceae bacterium]|nr:alpha-ribazole phosphatase [Nitrospiraceae bacterium]